MDALVQQSIIILALLNKFVYDYRGNNPYVIYEKTALVRTNQTNLGLILPKDCTFPKLCVKKVKLTRKPKLP